jgi:hypothetical protein
VCSSWDSGWWARSSFTFVPLIVGRTGCASGPRAAACVNASGRENVRQPPLSTPSSPSCDAISHAWPKPRSISWSWAAVYSEPARHGTRLSGVFRSRWSTRTTSGRPPQQTA